MVGKRLVMLSLVALLTATSIRVDSAPPADKNTDEKPKQSGGTSKPEAKTKAQLQPSIRLDAPPPSRGGEAARRAELEQIVRTKLDQVRKSLPAGAAPPAGLDDLRREVIIRGIPIGFGSLRQTAGSQDPGPKVASGDPRVIPIASQPLVERIIGRNNLMPVRFMEAGVAATKPVGRVAIKFEQMPDAGYGTGFLVSPSLFMTNNHVIDSKESATRLEAQFNYQYGLDASALLQPVSYEFDPDGFFYTDPALDFTLIRVKPRSVLPTGGGVPTSALAGVEFGFLKLTTSYFYSEGQLANVVQHPQGRPKEVALHDNEIVSIHDKVVRYRSDTEPGSSGSPVFNNSWKVIALHHSAGDEDPSGGWLNNEGVRIDKIIDHIKANTSAAIAIELGI